MNGVPATLDVVVVNFHSAPLISTTITIARRFAGAAAHVIFVDNSPGDGGADIVRLAEPGATIIENPVNRGYAAAVNQAVAVSRSDILLLLNPDVQAISGSYADVVDALLEPRIAAVVPRLLNTDGTARRTCICAPRPFDMISEDVALAQRFPRWQRPRRYRMLDWDQRDTRRVDAATGACLFLRRSAFADVGPFDERFFVYYEETDWLIRAKRLGWQTLFLPTIEATHVSAASSPGVRSQPSLLLLESQHLYARKHFGAFATAVLRTTMIGIDAARFARHGVARSTDRRAEAGARMRVHLTMHAPRPS